MSQKSLLFPLLFLLAGCNATINGPFLNQVKKEKKQAEDLTYIAGQLLQSPDLEMSERANLRWQQRKVQSELDSVSKIAEITRRHIEIPWWGDWFFPYDGWGETSFYVSDESLLLNRLLVEDLKDLKILTDQTEARLGTHIPRPFHPKLSAKAQKAEKAAEIQAEKIAKAKASGKITDPFHEKEPPEPVAQTEMETPPVPELQPEMQEFLAE